MKDVHISTSGRRRVLLHTAVEHVSLAKAGTLGIAVATDIILCLIAWIGRCQNGNANVKDVHISTSGRRRVLLHTAVEHVS